MPAGPAHAAIPATECDAWSLSGLWAREKLPLGARWPKKLRWNFLDLDDVIEQRERKSVAEIFASSGEPAFRRMESAALAALLQDQQAGGDLILALGGGAFVQKQNRDALISAGAITVLLEAPVEELRRRCQGEHKVRPLAQQDARFNELFAARRADYALARFTVQTLDKSVQQVTAEIEKLLQSANVRTEK